MWIHKLTRNNDETRLCLPRAIETTYGFRPGVFVALEVVDDHTLKVTLLGSDQETAAARLALTYGRYRRTRPPAPQRD